MKLDGSLKMITAALKHIQRRITPIRRSPRAPNEILVAERRG